MVWAEPAGGRHTDASTVCDLCGMTMPDLPVMDGDYFNVVITVTLLSTEAGEAPGRPSQWSEKTVTLVMGPDTC